MVLYLQNVYIAHPGPKASEQVEQKRSLIGKNHRYKFDKKPTATILTGHNGGLNKANLSTWPFCPRETDNFRGEKVEVEPLQSNTLHYGYKLSSIHYTVHFA